MSDKLNIPGAFILSFIVLIVAPTHAQEFSCLDYALDDVRRPGDGNHRAPNPDTQCLAEANGNFSSTQLQDNIIEVEHNIRMLDRALVHFSAASMGYISQFENPELSLQDPEIAKRYSNFRSMVLSNYEHFVPHAYFQIPTNSSLGELDLVDLETSLGRVSMDQECLSNSNQSIVRDILSLEYKGADTYDIDHFKSYADELYWMIEVAYDELYIPRC
ncbi:MAG: hypothetical protein AAGB04_30210 [Pseudomonadota bacterium]